MKYLSPSSIHCWLNDPEEFFMRYFTDKERDSQTQPMAIGSAFDARVKAFLYLVVYGKEKAETDGYGCRWLFEQQVAKEHWDWAWEHSEKVWRGYKELMIPGLLKELEGAVAVNFEFTLNDVIDGVPLLGKPDMFFVKDGITIIYDWKVNGYCAKRLKSPAKGYVLLRELGQIDKVHKLCTVVDGVNVELAMEEVDKTWADQLSVYAWLLGEPVGSDTWVGGIDQICGGGRMRFAKHRARVSSEWQKQFFAVAKDLWTRIQSGWIFADLSFEDNIKQQELLKASGEGIGEYGF